MPPGGSGAFTLTGARVFDGTAMRPPGSAVAVVDGQIAAVLPPGEAPRGTAIALDGGTLAPGFIDLQVNGGGGWQVGGDATAERFAAMCAVHARLGATGILPTLITDTPEATSAVIAAGVAVARAGVPGFLGLHLEGPHLDPRRQGAHDPALIRPMTDADETALVAARAQLPALMVTLAPAAAAPDRIARLTAAGVTVSLGHADCTMAEAQEAVAAGAACATHLFNAMSPLGHREPGLVGSVLSSDLPAGLIADGLHVAPAVLRIALAARPRGLFLVSDAMAFTGSAMSEMHLGGRLIRRVGGRLVLADGTLAGADLTLPQAVAMLAGLGVPLAQALAMATSVPAGVIGAEAGRIAPGARADLVHLAPDLSLSAVWRAGATVA
ncbi:MAG TPA: N-acetylglucosamine-6-phosphate deacetylase [Paracoccaceae bacterium]|nr:N-acetylglucosamine-6-phosphate deacetylase [Paracoccaceae bacterium]HMO70637.1 N-acetylglucosamine-6-phosphate deacetylase [Paracoccaceae bacterium]